MKGSARHNFVYKFAKLILSPFLRAKFNYKHDRIHTKNSPYIVVANHVTTFDALLVGMCFSESMYYVASDHLFRLGFIGKLLMFAVSPIPRAKATTDSQTVMQIFKRLKDGHNICIFAEGNSTFSGETGFIPPSIGKLAKRTGASLVTIRLRGGYFTLPRWSHNVRKGIMTGNLVHEYTPDELKTMSDEEMNDAVKRDLYVNAYDDQENTPIAFKGDRLAEHLEYTMYCCPKCKRFSTLKSSDDRLACDCGLEVRYTEFGYLEPYTSSSPKVPFTRILDWFNWQKEIIVESAAKSKIDFEASNKNSKPSAIMPIFSDVGQILIQTVRARRNIEIARGTVNFFYDRIVLVKADGSEIVFLLDSIIDMSILIQMNLIFTTSDCISYELHSEHPRSATKYLDLYREILHRPISV